MAIMMAEPIFQLMPNRSSMPAPVPEMLPMVKNRQARNRAMPTMGAPTLPKYLRMAWMVGMPVVIASQLVVMTKVMPMKMIGKMSHSRA